MIIDYLLIPMAMITDTTRVSSVVAATVRANKTIIFYIFKEILIIPSISNGGFSFLDICNC